MRFLHSAHNASMIQQNFELVRYACLPLYKKSCHPILNLLSNHRSPCIPAPLIKKFPPSTLVVGHIFDNHIHTYTFFVDRNAVSHAKMKAA